MSTAEGEPINRLVYLYARNKSFELYKEAVRRGIINSGQAEGLMSLWLETHPYEPLTATYEEAEDVDEG